MGSRSKLEKTMKNWVFSTFDCDPEIILKLLQHHGNLQWLSPKKYYERVFFHKKKIPSDIAKWSFSKFETKPESLSGIENFFFSNLTYSYSFLGWNLPGITMSLESLHNYHGITVKSRKNYEKFGSFDFWLWSRNNLEIIARSR